MPSEAFEVLECGRCLSLDLAGPAVRSVQCAGQVAMCPLDVAERLRYQAVNGVVLASLTERDLEAMGVAKRLGPGRLGPGSEVRLAPPARAPRRLPEGTAERGGRRLRPAVGR